MSFDLKAKVILKLLRGGQLKCPSLRGFCRSGLVSRKGCKAAPAICAFVLNPWGCLAALSRHKAAPTTFIHPTN
ncbi:hypothetical protein D0O09_19150 [Pseudomonas putida]|nr:hypothetical protein D0O09_19150 [Pseudomonas putida]